MVRKICSHIMYLFILMLFAISASLFSLALRFSLPVKFTSVVVSMLLLLSHNPLSYIFGASQPPLPFLQIHWDLSLSLSGTLLWSSSPPHLHLIRVAQGISFKVSISHLLTLFHQFLHSRGSVTILPLSRILPYDCFPMFQFRNKLYFSSKWFVLIGIKLPVEDLWAICLSN